MINPNATDRHECSYRPDPFGQTAMAVEFAFVRSPGKEDDKRGGQRRYNHMGYENGEAEGADPIVV